ncbi:MAG: hypothetical protein VYC34_02825, partial [Planctomycetota bacterium]|nr:hypothetical protein [Planctomycetota bacterium]
MGMRAPKLAANARTCSALALAAGICQSALAQDSVASTPGQSDALTAYQEQIVRFVADGAPITSSWGNEFFLAPALKATRGTDPFFNTQVLSSLAASPTALNNLTFTPTDFDSWSAPGQGINPAQNSAPNIDTISHFDRQFGVAFSDAGVGATNIVSAVIGRNRDAPGRLWITRVVAAASRASAMSFDTSTLSLGAVDPAGHVTFRADAPLEPCDCSGLEVAGENTVRVDITARNELSVNRLTRSGATNTAADAAATTFIRNADTVTTNTPVSIPRAIAAGGSPIAATIDFAGAYRAAANAPTTAHLAPGVLTHRGNPSYSTAAFFPGAIAGTFACIANSTAAVDRCDTLNLWGVNASGAVVATAAATLPPSISDGAGFTANNPIFTHWRSQISFRGANGPVAIGRAPDGRLFAAATAWTSATGQFIAMATLNAPGAVPTWRIIARIDSPILDGPNGQQRARIIAGDPVTFSAPAMDFLGNVYFVAAVQPNLGPPATALIKATPVNGEYRLERLLITGQVVTGQNSQREYQIKSLTLGDADSLASGSFYSANVVQTRTSTAITDPNSPLAAGAIIAAAIIEYDNGGVVEPYEAVLMLYPRDFGPILGDLTNDGVVNAADLA